MRAQEFTSVLLMFIKHDALRWVLQTYALRCNRYSHIRIKVIASSESRVSMKRMQVMGSLLFVTRMFVGKESTHSLIIILIIIINAVVIVDGLMSI